SGAARSALPSPLRSSGSSIRNEDTETYGRLSKPLVKRIAVAPTPVVPSSTALDSLRSRGKSNSCQRPVLKAFTGWPLAPVSPEAISVSGLPAVYLPKVRITEVPPGPRVVDVTGTGLGADFLVLPAWITW